MHAKKQIHTYPTPTYGVRSPSYIRIIWDRQETPCNCAHIHTYTHTHTHIYMHSVSLSHTHTCT